MNIFYLKKNKKIKRINILFYISKLNQINYLKRFIFEKLNNDIYNYFNNF
jgi:hypothetical protein